MATLSSFPGYCNSITGYSRLFTREVKVGDIGIGGFNPIRVQSMTTTDTMNTLATVEQSIRMIEAGCELVRITAPSINDAKNLENIKNELLKKGYSTPLVADIHFTPNAAEWAARIVEKVRVNPGNYADKKKFENIEYTDSAYDAELERIRERFTPLVKICKEYGTAMRIGTNHGSLSDRIMSRYGDSPLGMVESALEFLRICEENDYRNIVLSMKASNTQIMVQAYRLLIQKMHAENMYYPLHLGVTEAGEGEDGRIKSAVGIGTLLEDGIGDTIRVSLTEDPEFEIPVAMDLVSRYTHRNKLQSVIPSLKNQGKEKSHLIDPMKSEQFSIGQNPGYATNHQIQNIQLPYSPYEYNRRYSEKILNIGGHEVPRIIADFSHKDKLTPASFFPVGYNYSVATDKWNLSDQACDFIYTGNKCVEFELPGTLGIIVDAKVWANNKNKQRHYPLQTAVAFINGGSASEQLNFILVSVNDCLNENFLNKIKGNQGNVLVLETSNEHGMAEQRRAFIALEETDCSIPVIIKRNYSGISPEQFQLHASTDAGALLLDGFGDGLWISASGIASEKSINATAFGILQATRTRISKTEYISCPSCGRTLFDLQETTAKIRSRTDHLKGVKIGIMGCIVNGPGEMADADYGYVGTGPGKITLYKGKEVVERNIDEHKAVDALIELIRKHGDWQEANSAFTELTS
ncbi:MAG TPA: (E)-4-hydroxy-3-methylbut-2-enyl-diphosphate synthase [Bacteroidia bacterium]|nr:(E)-4-hydroxy-3-methylbut-2-enyl-diphosphate synthase [Bacteroidia bacterium]HNP97768.1 (E)-4-hydroxy-3-methylbut-2-enyl-diphosphate synthase [Bacteroidia bacterium]